MTSPQSVYLYCLHQESRLSSVLFPNADASLPLEQNSTFTGESHNNEESSRAPELSQAQDSHWCQLFSGEAELTPQALSGDVLVQVSKGR